MLYRTVLLSMIQKSRLETVDVDLWNFFASVKLRNSGLIENK
jgi:hypothetical protein